MKSDSTAVKMRLADLQTEFRRQTAALNPEVVKRCHPWRFADPCQTVDLWLKSEDLHLITIVHYPTAKDGRVDVFGPLEYEDLVPAMEESLKAPVWQESVDPDQDSLFVLPHPHEPGQPLRLHQLQVDFLAGKLKKLSGLLFHKRYRRKGMGTYSRTIQELSHLEWFGALESINPATEIAKMVAQATHDYRSYQDHQDRMREKPQPQQAPPAPSEPWEGWWTCLFPRITIGTSKPRSLWAVFIDQPVELSDTPRTEIQQVPHTPFRFTSEGYVLVDTHDERRARRTLNHIVFLLGREGLNVRAIGPHDCAGFFRSDESQDFPPGPFRGWTTPTDSARRKPTSAMDELFGWIDSQSEAYVSRESFLTLAASAWHLSASDWANEVEWLVDSEGHAVEGRSSASLLTAWIGIERITFGLLDQELNRSKVPPPVRTDIGRKRFQDAVRLARDLGLKGAPTPSDVGPLAQLRNQVAHQGHEATAEEAATVRDLLRRLLVPLVDAEIQRLMTHNAPHAVHKP